MASYQVPQFLDSGDKIIFGLNMRQFGYAIVGFLLCFTIFSLFQPALGNFAVIPCLPIAALFSYLAFGKFNGRDSEIYVLRTIIFLLKPRAMVYARKPDMQDIEEKMSDYTYGKIVARWNSHLDSQKQIDNNEYLTFKNQDPKSKAAMIRSLGTNLDQSYVSGMTAYQEKSIRLAQIQGDNQQPGPQVIHKTNPEFAGSDPKLLKEFQEHNFFN